MNDTVKIGDLTPAALLRRLSWSSWATLFGIGVAVFGVGAAVGHWSAGCKYPHSLNSLPFSCEVKIFGTRGEKQPWLNEDNQAVWAVMDSWVSDMKNIDLKIHAEKEFIREHHRQAVATAFCMDKNYRFASEPTWATVNSFVRAYQYDRFGKKIAVDRAYTGKNIYLESVVCAVAAGLSSAALAPP